MSNATITGVRLYNTVRDNWIIDGIKCDFVYWDAKPLSYLEDKEKEKQWEVDYRVPKDRDFRPGEFEERYKQLPTFEYYFEQGFTPIDAVVMDKIVQDINTQNPDFELKLITLNSRGQPHATFTVLHKEHAEPAKQQITTDYEARIAALEGKHEQFMELVSTLINKPQYIGRDYIEMKDTASIQQLTTGTSKGKVTRDEEQGPSRAS